MCQMPVFKSERSVTPNKTLRFTPTMAVLRASRCTKGRAPRPNGSSFTRSAATRHVHATTHCTTPTRHSPRAHHSLYDSHHSLPCRCTPPPAPPGPAPRRRGPTGRRRRQPAAHGRRPRTRSCGVACRKRNLGASGCGLKTLCSLGRMGDRRNVVFFCGKGYRSRDGTDMCVE